jgi:DNA invertase Pin-like site-specific DNA recombinase
MNPSVGNNRAQEGIVGDTIIYIRTSTDEQHPELQLDDCKKLAETLGLKEYKVVQDQTSGWKDKEREGFDGVLARIKKREISHLICWDLDRLYRNRKKLVSLFEISKVFGCKIHSVRQDWLETINHLPEPFNEMMHSWMLQVMGWMAEEESIKKSQRVKLAIKEVNGIKYSKFGNKWGRKEISTQAKNKIMELYSQGKSMREIRDLVKCGDKNISLGIVHKTITSNRGEKTRIKDVHLSSL